MSYVIMGSERSPFVRLCRMLMLKNSIPFEFKVRNFVEDANAAAEVARENPINKVPVLYDGEKKIFDSRVIANYLIQKHSLRPLTLEEENTVSAIYSCLDTGVILFLTKRDGFDLNHPGFFMSRQRARIPSNLKWLTPWVKALDPARDWHYPAMSLYAFLYWVEKREVFDLTDYPEMREFMTKFQSQSGVPETSF